MGKIALRTMSVAILLLALGHGASADQIFTDSVSASLTYDPPGPTNPPESSGTLSGTFTIHESSEGVYSLVSADLKVTGTGSSYTFNNFEFQYSYTGSGNSTLAGVDLNDPSFTLSATDGTFNYEVRLSFAAYPTIGNPIALDPSSFERQYTGGTDPIRYASSDGTADRGHRRGRWWPFPSHRRSSWLVRPWRLACARPGSAIGGRSWPDDNRTHRKTSGRFTSMVAPAVFVAGWTSPSPRDRRSVRNPADVFLEQGAGSGSVASGVGAEGGDGVGRLGGIVVKSTGQAGHLVGAARPVDDGPVVDDPQSPFDGPDKVVGLAEVVVGVGGEEPGLAEGVERLPEVRPGDLGAVGVAELEVLHEEFDIGETAKPSLEVVRPSGVPPAFDASPRPLGRGSRARSARAGPIEARPGPAGRTPLGRGSPWLGSTPGAPRPAPVPGSSRPGRRAGSPAARMSRKGEAWCQPSRAGRPRSPLPGP